ncbi:MAG: hypothetical protein EBU21_15530, partial [Proteobacteria bacterium]|nr:hypothetical protein [Pseudomonadota bacterium]
DRTARKAGCHLGLVRVGREVDRPVFLDEGLTTPSRSADTSWVIPKSVPMNPPSKQAFACIDFLPAMTR